MTNTLAYLFWGQCYKTFYVRNLRIFIIARVFVPGRPFQPSHMFVSKAPICFPTLGYAPGLTNKH